MSVDLDISDRVATLTLNRPKTGNALNLDMMRALHTHLDVLGREGGLRAIVLKGKGRHFCSGVDLQEMIAAGRSDFVQNREHALTMATLLDRLNAVATPTVCVVHGAAIAIGTGLAAACDIVVAERSSKFGLPEVRLGVVPAVTGPHLARAVGQRRARQLMLQGHVFSADDAMSWGLIHVVVAAEDMNDQINAILADLRRAGPDAIAFTKSAFADRLPASSYTSASVMAWARAGEEAQEGLAACVERRYARWINE